MRDQLLKAITSHAKGEIERHRANVEVYLNNPAGIGEHPDVLAAIQTELDKICTNEERIDIINKHFKS